MPALAPLRAAARDALFRLARDHSDTAAARSALILAPHPDDETLGCGGRILLARQAGTAVTVVVASDGTASQDGLGMDREGLRRLRSVELAVATRRLGVRPADVIELGYPDGELGDHLEALTEDLRRLLIERRPDEVYCTSQWEVHPDHAAASIALRRAVRSLARRPAVLEYPIWLWADWPLSRRRLLSGPPAWLRTVFGRRVVRVEAPQFAAAKRAALESYGSQLGDAGLPAPVLDRALSGSELFFLVGARALAPRPRSVPGLRARAVVVAVLRAVVGRVHSVRVAANVAKPPSAGLRQDE